MTGTGGSGGGVARFLLGRGRSRDQGRQLPGCPPDTRSSRDTAPQSQRPLSAAKRPCGFLGTRELARLLVPTPRKLRGLGRLSPLWASVSSAATWHRCAECRGDAGNRARCPQVRHMCSPLLLLLLELFLSQWLSGKKEHGGPGRDGALGQRSLAARCPQHVTSPHAPWTGE